MKAPDAREAPLVEPDEQETEAAEPAEEPKASARAITTNLITGGLGSGIFSLPWSVAGSSIVSSVMIIAVVLILNAWTISILVRAAERYDAYDIGSILAKFPRGLGSPLQLVTNLCMWIVMFLCLVSYIIVIHDSAKTLVGDTVLDNRILLVALGSAFVLPLCFLSQRLLERTSGLAIAINIYLFLLVGVLYGKSVGTQTLPEGCCILGSTIRGNFAMTTVMFYSVVIQMCVLPMYKALENRSPRKFDRITATGFTVLFFLFSGFSCLAYLLVGPDVQSNILQDLPKGPASTVAEAGMILVVACVYPIMLAPMIAPIEARQGSFLGCRPHSAARAAKCLIVAAVMATAFRVTSLGVVNVISGAMSALVFVAVIPSIVGYCLLDSGKCQKVALGLLLFGGVAVSLLGFVFNDNYVDDLRCYIEA